MILEALADRLTSASVATVGTNLFIGMMPDQPDLCVSLFEYAGAAPLEVLRDNAATVERPGVQVLVRAGRNDYPGGRNLAVSVRDVLTNITDEEISNVRFLRVSALSAVNSTGTDEKDRPQFTIAMQAVAER
jgi:hypothetical protein